MTVALDLVTLDWITADEEYGRNGEFLDELERLERRYVVEVPVNTTVWTEDPASCVAATTAVGAGVPSCRRRESVATVVDGRVVPAGWGVADAACSPGGQGAALLRVRRGAGLGGASPQAWPADLAAGAPVAGG